MRQDERMPGQSGRRRVQPCDHVTGRARGRDYAEPLIHGIARYTGFRDRRNLGCDARALGAAQAERAGAAVLDVR